MSGVSGWAVVVPVKRLDLAKSRLRLPSEQRRELVTAMAADTVVAARSAAVVEQVIVVTDDDGVGQAMLGLGATVVSDEPDAGLNAALRHGITVARRQRRRRPVATLAADLPALTGVVLDAALRGVRQSAVVADRGGTGTTLLAAGAGTALEPEYGDGSFARHRDAGAADLTRAVDMRLRLDVDTLADLQVALRLGVGRHTAAVCARLDLPHP